MNDATIDPCLTHRWKPVVVHVAISVVLLGLALLLLGDWYPDDMFRNEGGWQVLLIIAGADLVLGPVLTTIAASPGKRVRVFRQDLAVISLLQAAAMAAGLWIGWEYRPYAMLWLDGEVNVVPWASLRQEPAAFSRVQALRAAGHELLQVRLSSDPMVRDLYLEAARKRHSSVLFTAELYQPFDPADEDVRKQSLRIARIAAGTPLGARLAESGVDIRRALAGDVLVLPVRARYHQYLLLLDAKTGKRLGTFSAANRNPGP